MKIDLHIHSRTCSDGRLSIEEIFEEAINRKIDMLSITDHDTMDCQQKASVLAEKNGIRYITGMELNISFEDPVITEGKKISLDFLAYNYDPADDALRKKLRTIAEYRNERALKIMENINIEFEKEGIEKLTVSDIEAIQASVDGTFGRPHIAHYLVEKGIVNNKQEAFDRFLVRCDVPKFPFKIEDASKLVKDAGGIIVMAHPNDPNGTSLVKLSNDVKRQTGIIESAFLDYIDGVECWHTRNDPGTTSHYVEFGKKHELIMTGGSDCHQNPIIMGTVEVPDFVAEQFE